MSIGAVPSGGNDKQLPPLKSKVPQQVQLKLNNINTVLSWQDFIDLLTCCHEFETNTFPRHVRSRNVEVKLL